MKTIIEDRQTSSWEVIAQSSNVIELSGRRLGELPLDVLCSLNGESTLSETMHDIRMATRLVNDYIPEVNVEWHVADVEDNVLGFVHILRKVFGSLEGVREKHILDLACGSAFRLTDNFSYYNGNRTFEPWMCRLIHQLGGHPVGIDIRMQADEPFEWGISDLDDPESLSFLPDAYFDACHCGGFIKPRPSLDFEDPRTEKWVAEWNLWQQNLERQMERVLKPNGFYFGSHLPWSDFSPD